MSDLTAYDQTLTGTKLNFGGEEKFLPQGAYLVTLGSVSLKQPSNPVKDERFDKWKGGTLQVSAFFTKPERAETGSVMGAIESNPEEVAKAIASNAKFPYHGWQIVSPNFFLLGVPDHEKTQREEQGLGLQGISANLTNKLVRAFQLWKIMNLDNEYSEFSPSMFLSSAGEFTKNKPKGFIQIAMGKAYGNREASDEIRPVLPESLSAPAQALIDYKPAE